MRVGLFFGSFNPIHTGHLIIAQSLLNTGGVDVVWLVVSPHNPHKSKAGLAPAADRLRMVEIATEGNEGMQASNVEFLLPQPSYTVDTLTHLAARYKSYRFALLMGEDNLRSLPRWRNPEAILRNYPLFVYPRLRRADETTGPAPPPVPPGDITYVPSPLIDLSATAIRDLLRTGRDARYLVPDAVLAYIRQHALYVA